MKRFMMAVTDARIFIAGFCSAICLVMLFFAIQPQAASGDDDAMLRELREMNAEISGLRQDLRLMMSSMGILLTEEEKAVDEIRKSASVEAADIISNLRNLMYAGREYFADNMDTANKPDFKPEISMLTQYTDRPEVLSSGHYLFQKSADGKWWVGFDLKAAGETDELKARLADRAGGAGLYGTQDFNIPYTDQDIVWVIVR